MPAITQGAVITAAGQIASGIINNSHISDTAAIVDTKLAAIAGGSTTLPPGGRGAPNVLFGTTFETAGRFSSALVGSGGVTFNTSGIGSLRSGSTADSHSIISYPLTEGTLNLQTGSPIFRFRIKLTTLGATEHDMFIGIAATGIMTTGDFDVTENHAGFYIRRRAAGAVDLFASQADGTTETRSASLTTVAADDVLDLCMVINGTTSIDYYFSKNGGAFSSATNQTTNLPTGTIQAIEIGVGNVASAENNAYAIIGASYEQ